MKNILIIEDNKTLTNLLREKLTQAGYSVAEAEDGIEGLKSIEKQKPDLVLLDIMMPNVDGFGVLEDMKSKGLTDSLPVVIISNSGQPVEIDRALALGVKDYLVKADFTPQEVLDKVKGQIGEGEDQTKQSPEEDGVKGKNAPSTASGSGHTILIVEDDEFLRNLLVHKLTVENFKVEIAENGEEAFKKVNQYHPKIILLDLVLPDIDGFEILKTLKKDKDTKDIPVIVLSNLGQKEDIERCMELGAADHLVKAELAPNDIVDKIKHYLGK